MPTAARVLLVGATSAIAVHLARGLATRGASLYLTGRDPARLDAIVADLRVRGATQVVVDTLDLRDNEALTGLAARAAAALDGLDTVVVAAGTLPDQTAIDADPALLVDAMQVNATGAMLVLGAAAAHFEQQGHGLLVAIGSVAGDRGRAVNAVYGAAKGALEIYLSGLRQRLRRRGVGVLLVKPGFVDTPMTAGFKKTALWATPQRVAQDILRAMDRGRSVLYTPWFWRWIMLIIRHVPEAVFVRMKF
jgi:decaprenylphospho-beta-D-erythro-pentofuranosid-2-ulose 2-reductase